MIVVNITSRLGNQLFQVAFAYATSRRLNTRFYLDYSGVKKRNRVDRFFETKHIHASHKVSPFIYFVTKYILRNAKMDEVLQNGFEAPGNLIERSSTDKIYKGYFQSSLYFSDAAGEIKKMFTLREKFRKQFAEKYAAIFKHKTVVVHIRRTDYVTYGKHELGGKNLCLPDSYTYNSLAQVKDIDACQLLFISDDIDYVKNTFLEKYPKARFESNHAAVDLQLLIHADILVISNSSFAWWGAYLNNKNPVVYAPEYWLGFKVKKEYPEAIIPQTWNRVPVYAAQKKTVDLNK